MTRRERWAAFIVLLHCIWHNPHLWTVLCLGL